MSYVYSRIHGCHISVYTRYYHLSKTEGELEVGLSTAYMLLLFLLPSYHIISHLSTSRHITSYHIISHHITLHHIKSQNVTEGSVTTSQYLTTHDTYHIKMLLHISPCHHYINLNSSFPVFCTALVSLLPSCTLLYSALLCTTLFCCVPLLRA